ncbi:MAG: DUF5050 domain-containing protein [Clostridia bacterium]
MKIFRIVLPVLVVFSLLLSACNSGVATSMAKPTTEPTSKPIQASIAPVMDGKHPMVINNGGAAIKVGDNSYYITKSIAYESLSSNAGALYSVGAKGISRKIANIGGSKIWALGDSLYVSAEYPSVPESTFKINPSGGTPTPIFDGNIKCIGLDNKSLYYSGDVQSSEKLPMFEGLYKINIDTLKTEMIVDANDTLNCEFLITINGKLYYYTTTNKNIVSIHCYDMKSGKTSLLTTHKPSEDINQSEVNDLQDYAYEVTQLSACGEWLIYSIGDYEGSGHFFYGNIFRIKPDGTDKALLNILDTDNFLVYGDWIFYSEQVPGKYNVTSIIHPDLSGKQAINKFYEICTITPDGWLFYNTEEGDIHRSRIDGSNDTLLLKSDKLPNYLKKEDRYQYALEIVGDLVYFNAEVWGYRMNASWRPQFIDSSFNRINMNGTGLQTLTQVHSQYDKSGK